MFIMMIAGLILVAAGTTYAVRHPRATGEPFSPARKLYLGAMIAGAAFIGLYAAYVSADS